MTSSITGLVKRFRKITLSLIFLGAVILLIFFMLIVHKLQYD